MIYILVLVFLALLIASYFLFNREIVAPALIFTAAYFASVLCATLNVNTWGIDIKLNTFLILVIGAIEFIAISYLVYKRFKAKENHLTLQMKRINVSNILLYLLIIYNIIVIGLLFYNVLKIASMFGEYSNFSQALTIYKDNTSYVVNASLPGYLTIMLKPVIASAYIGVYVFWNNFFSGNTSILNRIKKEATYLIFPLMYCVQRVIESNRGSILNLVISFVVIGVLFWSINVEWRKYVPIKVIGKLFLVGCIGLVTFYYSASLVGRINTKGMFEYITYYVGGSIECFNQWMQQPDSIETFPGEYTFKNTVNDLNELGILDEQIDNTNYSAFIYHNDVMVGNIYTSYRSWIHDFGYIGAVILQGILALFFNIVYYSIRFCRWKGFKHSALILFYGYSSYVLLMHPIDSYFYLEFFTKATIFLLLVTFLMQWIAENLRIELVDRKQVELEIKGNRFVLFNLH